MKLYTCPTASRLREAWRKADTNERPSAYADYANHRQECSICRADMLWMTTRAKEGGEE